MSDGGRKGPTTVHDRLFCECCYNLRQADKKEPRVKTVSSGNVWSLSGDREASWRLALAHKGVRAHGVMGFSRPTTLREELVEAAVAAVSLDRKVHMKKNWLVCKTARTCNGRA